MTPPRSFTNLHRAGRSTSPKLCFLEWNKTKEMSHRVHGAAATATMDFLAPDILDKCGRAVPAPDRPIGSTLADIAIGLGRDHPLHFQGQRPKMLCKQRIQFSLCLVCREVPYQRALSRVGLEFLPVRNHILHPIIPLDGRTPTTVS